MTNLTMNSDEADIIRTVIVAIVYLIIFSVLTQITFLRRDVNCNEK